ncbi:KH domain-containing protein [Colletotrichum higginsianum]|uniref:KH domain-containing protein n=2 Tax=Colletotrichum higginsianum TaxID=80884 RepID=H1UZL5_COLHI|nr:KH domain-containing protein [Colletotrichum higginsianum IMI 349063]OBR09376.1 KH domain-containing protein [Colletotrichum higginsianum IMI 349063]TIC95836.1 Vigilin 1 [Colletotrichum higginsianum]GJC96556.1 KH domain-containing protein [Colletotrichum higginsianum]CCF33416.1 KH domain-containing protein [Colletotrichum higginsianum]
MASTDSAVSNGAEPSAAQKLLQTHADHHPTVEDVPDEDLPLKSGDSATWAEPISTKAAGKQKETSAPSKKFDPQSHDLFPELGASSKAPTVAPIWGAKSNVSTPANGLSRSSTPASGNATPKNGPPSMSIPGRNVETVVLEPQFILPRGQLKRPIPDIMKDINRKSRANITLSTATNGRLKFDATGPQDVAQQALKDLVQQIGTKTTIKVPIPQSARAHIIGKGGSVIKAIQEKSGARVQLPKAEEGSAPVDEDDDSTIDVLVEGNALSAASARNEILKIAGERTANVNTKLRGIPAEFYPFIAGPGNSHVNQYENNGVQVRVPPHQIWAPRGRNLAANEGERPVFVPATDNHIQLAGDRAAVQAARAEIERRVQELQNQLAIDQFSLQKGRHQFIAGRRGESLDEFFGQTGCTILLPTDDDDDSVTVIGPIAQLSKGVETAMDRAMNMQSTTFDIGRFHKNAPGGVNVHARHVTRYLRHRDLFDDIERAHSTHISTPFNASGSSPYELYSRDGKKALQAQSAIEKLVHAVPPARIAPIPVDPFYHNYLVKDVGPRMRNSHGVHVILPESGEPDAPVLLVFEGPTAPEPKPEIKTGRPSDDEIRTFQEALEVARKQILDIINKQEQIASASIDVPQKFHERLRRFIKKEQANRADDQIPIRVSSVGTVVTLRGPASAVKKLEDKVIAFVEQEKEDEKERGFTMSFDFPQKFANHLIGKGGSNIKELRDRFDVEIQVQDGKVELKGPKAKAEAAKAHISSLSRTLADEVTHILKVDPKFHRELIGAGGSVTNRLQNKYKVLIFFPRSGKSPKDDEVNADAVSDAGKPKRHQEPDEVIVRGPKKGADEARDEILSLLQYLKDTSFTATVSVQQKQVPSIIGQGGAALEELRISSGAKIDIPSGRDADTVEIQIKGTKAQVAAAKKALEEKRDVFNDTIVRTIEVDKKHHKSLIGTGGANLRDLVIKAGGSDDRRELARTIQFPKQEADGHTIKVEGRSDIVNKICARIEEIVAEKESQITEVLDVPTEKHRTLIGRGGDAKRQLEAQFTVSIDIPRQGDGKTGVKITGRPENVEKAKEHIASLVKEQEGETLQVPRSLHHSISNNGQFFRQLRNNHQISVDHAGQSVPPKPSSASRSNGSALPLITDDDDATADVHSWKVVDSAAGEDGDIAWVLRGSPENIEKAKAAIASAIEQARKNTHTGYLVLPDPKTYRYVIGQGGSKVNSIRKQSGCKINVPRNDDKEDAIEVIGTAEGVEKAKGLILDAVKEGLSSRVSRD